MGYTKQRFILASKHTFGQFFEGWSALLNYLVPLLIATGGQVTKSGLDWKSTWQEIATWFLSSTVIWGVVVWFYNFIFKAPYDLFTTANQQAENRASEVARLQFALIPKLKLSVGNSGSYKHGFDTGYLYRIGLTNLSELETVREVSVEVTEIFPSGPPFLPAKLHQMHDNAGSRRESKDVLPSQTVYYDLLGVQMDGAVTRPIAYISLRHIVTGAQTDFMPNNIRRVKIVAYSSNSSRVELLIDVTQVQDGNIDLVVAAA